VRVERLELSGIGPFRNTQVIDLAQLAESGLFLIDGPTGAGKTTIIDAIVFALFSGLSGNDSSKERLRSDHSLGTEKSEVILDFSVHGRKHRITRSPAYQAAKANSEGFTNKPAKQSLIEYHPDESVYTA
jgi:exonuclease SbcC